MFRKILFADYFQFNFSFITIAEIDFGFEITQFLDIIEDMDLPAVDLIAFLFADSAGDLH